MRPLPNLINIIRGLWCVMHKSNDVIESYYFETKGRAMNKLKKLNKKEKQPFLFKNMSNYELFFNKNMDAHKYDDGTTSYFWSFYEH